MHNPNLVVITGGPGSGKSTLLQELSRRGFPTSARANFVLQSLSNITSQESSAI